MILVLPNMIMEPSDVKKKHKGTTKCDKRTVFSGSLFCPYIPPSSSPILLVSFISN